MAKAKNIKIGEVYVGSYWTINKFWSAHNKKGKSTRYINATCQCGTIRDMEAARIFSGGKSCGCYQKEIMTEIKSKIPNIGQIFGWWEILYRTDDYIYKNPKNNPRAQYVCKCICGNEKVIRINELYRGDNTNCGCKKRERIIKQSTKHGDAKRGNCHRFYKLWKNINKRCDPKGKNNPRYSRWSGRGISVCEEWNKNNPNGWINFKGYMENNPNLANKPEGDYSFDRIDNNKGYQPNNVKWSTRKEQNENTEVMKTYRQIGNKREDRDAKMSWRNRRDYEKYYNVKITKGNQLHHIDWDWKNNNISNLIEVTKIQHRWLHRANSIKYKDLSKEELIVVLKNNFN
jgi:hypothetical protein